MREVVKRYKYRRCYFYILSAGIIFFVLFLLDILIITIERKNYEEKVYILCSMISNEDNFKKATELLKGKKENNIEKDKELLETYGYNLEKYNTFYEEYFKNCIYIVIATVLLYLIILPIIFLLYKMEKQKRKDLIEVINKTILNFRNEVFEQEEEFLERSENKEMESLYHNIHSLGSSVQILNEQSIREKEETKSLVTDISHQLKTPVTALKTSFEILQQEDLSVKEKQEFANRCSLLLKGIENLTDALVNISRLEIGLIAIKREEKCLFDTILNSINRIYFKGEQKQIQIEMEGEEELQEIKIPHDNKWLSEAFINILDNAVKYSPSGKIITIRMMKRSAFVRIEIEDQGIGIQKSEYNQIFKRFYRGNRKEVKEESGSGVGLYLAREIISRHNGLIRVSSGKMDGGSIFVIQLPYSI